LENLLLNPTLSDLVGGIQAVTLSDEEARRRGTQKTVLERRAPPTFDVLIEIIERDRMAVHPDVAASVDALVRSMPLQPEVRFRNPEGEVVIEQAPPPLVHSVGYNQQQGFRRGMGPSAGERFAASAEQRATSGPMRSANGEATAAVEPSRGQSLQPVRVFPYGVARNRLMQSAKRLGVPAIVVREIGEADALITLRAYYRSREQTILEAEQRGMPIYVLRANTNNQIEQLLAELFNLSTSPAMPENWDEYTLQTQAAIQTVMSGERYVDLAPASAAIRRMQHEMARQAELISQSYGKEPNRRVRIYRE